MTVFFLAATAMLVAALALILLPLLRRRPETTEEVSPAPATLTGVITAIVVPIVAVGLYLGITSYPWRGEGSSGATPSAQPASMMDQMVDATG